MPLLHNRRIRKPISGTPSALGQQHPQRSTANMSTLAADSRQAPRQSSAIYTGTDQLLAHFEAEKAKIDTAANQRVQATEAKLENFHDLAEKSLKCLMDRCVMLDDANKRIAASLSEAINETFVSRAQHTETQQRLTQALNELMALQQAARNLGTKLTDVDPAPQEATAKTEEVPIHNGAQSQGQSHVGNDSAYLLMQSRSALLEQARRSRILERERDELKQQLSSLRNEMKQWKTLHESTGPQETMTGHMNAESISDTLRSESKSMVYLVKYILTKFSFHS